MAQATFSVRMDENLKKQFDNLCLDRRLVCISKNYGMNFQNLTR